MVVEMEMEAHMDGVLQSFDLLLDGDRDGHGPCESFGAAAVDGSVSERRQPADGCFRGSVRERAGGSDRSRSGSGGGGGGGGPATEGKEATGGGAVKERIARALRIYKDAAGGDGGGALVQVWAPARDGGRRVLATRGQPFVLAPPQCHRLFQYRTVSLTHAFPVGGAGVPGERGLPGRVFDAGVPEWTPNVQYYGTGEYARISYALIYDIQAALVLPILDPGTGSCVAVIELVTTSPRLRFADEVDKLSNALQAVALRGSEICRPAPELCNDEAAELAMSEVSDILNTVGEAHRLPLAQAWVRCKRCNARAGQASLTAAGAPFYVANADESLRGFREACVEHHLRHGRGGLVEEAAAARGPRLCGDVTKYSMDAYPLAHHARFCGLAGCLAVCVQLRRDDDASMDDGSLEECVLEFFLPPDCRDGAVQKAAADAVAATIMERFGSGHLKAIVISGLQDLVFEIVADGECMLRSDTVIMADAPELELNDDHGGDERDSVEDGLHLAAGVGTADIEAPKMNSGDRNGGEDPRSQVGEKKKKTKRKGEKTVSLEVLQQYFSGCLKDAARSLGVCPTTMKRICRQHGISRWPFRKIAKANRSLDKIKRVFEAVPGSSKPMPVSTPAAVSRRDHALPCQSSALGMASSQGSCHAPPPPSKEAALRPPSHGGEAGVVTVKASHRGDIIRFRVPSSAGVATVKGEVAKRLGLEASEFDVKYLDDDNEWVLLSCDADFQECLDVVPALSGASTSSGSGAAPPVVRLMVQEVAEIHGSSCGSSD
ncbi:Protein NLP6 [Dichanthelium oligosanthes]|uniref:Protein NLP6 n=1 Tax=Dichanthelium oligosanthes TaxID=888268 RepID=A0A1E5V1F2_9POAL|nr:Protein NLP6 [Dichanthelium oligosanthes]